MGDNTSFGATKYVRSKMGTDVVVDCEGFWYRIGDLAGNVTSAGKGIVAKGGVKLGAKAAGKTGAKSIAKRNLDNVTAEQIVPASIKRSKSWAGELANYTFSEIKKIATNAKDPRRQKAIAMKKLIEQQERLAEKPKGKKR